MKFLKEDPSQKRFSTLNKVVRVVIGIVLLACSVLLITASQSPDIISYILALLLLILSVDCFVAAYKGRHAVVEMFGTF